MKSLRFKWGRELLFVGLLLVVASYTASNLRVQTSMARLLPPADRELSQLAQQVIESTLSRSMVLSIGANPDVAQGTQSGPSAQLKAARTVAAQLAKDPEVRWVRTGPDPELESAIYDLYFPRRFNFVASSDQALEQRLSPQGLRRSIKELKRQLAGPSGAMIARLAERDPLLLFHTHLERLETLGPAQLRVVDGQFLSEDAHAIVFVGLEHSALDGSAQQRLLQRISQLFAAEQLKAPSLILEQSGLNVFAVDSENRIKQDISRVALFSGLGIVLLFLVLFRSIKSLFVATLPLVTGLLMALAACMLTFGEVHALTLAFGASLLGVCIDYPVHLMNHQGLSQKPQLGVPRGVRAGLILGACTTVVGISALGFTGFSVMQQVALFSAVGLLSALAVTLWILPRHSGAGRVELRRRLAEQLLALLVKLAQRPRLLVTLCLVPFVLGIAGLCQARFATDLEGLAPLDPQLRAEDARVRSRIGAPGSNEVVLAVAEDPEQALINNRLAFEQLTRAEKANLIDSFTSLDVLLRSDSEQRRSFEAITSPRVARDLRQALEREGFNVESFEPFFSDQRQKHYQPLTLAELNASPLAPWLQPFAFSTGNQTTIVSYPKAARAHPSLAEFFASTEGVHFIDQRSLLDAAYSALRARVSWLMILGALCMAVLVFARFRQPRATIATLLPALVAPLAALGGLALLGETLNLFHLFAALVVLSMAMDYGIFLSESVRRSGTGQLSTGGTLLSIVVAAMTTCLSFGLLGFSDVPVLTAIGRTVALGIVAALLAAPFALLVQRSTLANE